MINLETPKKFGPLVARAHQVATEVLRPISREYDRAEHAYPKELDMLAALIDGTNAGSDMGAPGATGVRRDASANGEQTGNRNGANLSTVLGVIEMCWGDVGLLLTLPRQGLGNSAIASKQGFAGAMQTFDNTRPLVAGMAVGVTRAALEETRRRLADVGVAIDYDRPAHCQHAAAARFLQMEADYEAARLMTLHAAWMADNSRPNSLQASVAKAN